VKRCPFALQDRSHQAHLFRIVVSPAPLIHGDLSGGVHETSPFSALHVLDAGSRAVLLDLRRRDLPAWRPGNSGPLLPWRDGELRPGYATAILAGAHAHMAPEGSDEGGVRLVADGA